MSNDHYRAVTEYVQQRPGERVPDVARDLNMRGDTLRHALRHGRVPGVEMRPSTTPGDRAYRLFPARDAYDLEPPPSDWPSEQGMSKLDILLREYAEISAAVHAAQKRMDQIKEEIKRCV